MNYEILIPETPKQKYYVIPSLGSGRCYSTENEEQAKQILRFIKNKTPELIQNVRKLNE